MTTQNLAQTYPEALQKFIEQWRSEHPGEPFENAKIAQWMLANGYWKPQPRRLVKELAKHLARAANLKHVTNEQGKRVRVYHAARFDVPGSNGEKQTVLWDHRETMSADHAHISFQQRWDQVAGQCISLSNDQDDWNWNNPNAAGHKSQLTFDFTHAVEPTADQPVEEITPHIPKIVRERRERSERAPR